VDRVPVLDRQRRLGDQLGDARADHLDAEQLVGLRVGDDLDQAFCLAEGECPAAGLEWEAADLHLVSGLARLSLAEADVGDLRLGVDAVRRGVVVRHAVASAGDVLHRADALVGGHMGEHDAADHVADRPHASGGRPQVVVDLDPLAVELDTGRVEAETVRVG
jgi:hypothetical protein